MEATETKDEATPEKVVMFLQSFSAQLTPQPWITSYKAQGHYGVMVDGKLNAFDASLYLTVPVGNFLAVPLGDHYKVTVERLTADEIDQMREQGAY